MASHPQTKKPKVIMTPPPAVASTPLPTPQIKVDAPAKRNERPGADLNTNLEKPANSTRAARSAYFYEFTRPGFSYGRILIEHDEAGKGKVSFLKDGFDEFFNDPIELSAVTLTRINEALAELKFMDSTQNYQHARDYSHMGNVTFRLNRDGRERAVKYNWTDNASAKALMDEYRRVANEYTWRFEISVARENQPLQTPGLMETIDSYIRRNEVSDPKHLLPFLIELSTDERLPLMARNRSVKLIKQIENVRPK